MNNPQNTRNLIKHSPEERILSMQVTDASELRLPVIDEMKETPISEKEAYRKIWQSFRGLNKSEASALATEYETSKMSLLKLAGCSSIRIHELDVAVECNYSPGRIEIEIGHDGYVS